MTIHANLNSIITRAVQIACQGNPDGALQVLQPLGLTQAQNAKITAVFQGIRSQTTDAPPLHGAVLAIVNENPGTVSVQNNPAPPLNQPIMAPIPAASLNQPVTASVATGARCSLLDMPNEILNLIFSNLLGKDIAACSRVCRGINSNKTLQRLKNYLIHLNSTNGVYSLRTLQGHTSSVVCSLAVLDGKLCSGYSKGTIKIWDPETGECLQTLQGHAYSVPSLAALDGKLCSGSDDKTIKLWDPETGKYLQTLQGHAYPVQSLVVLDGKLCSRSLDNIIKIWDPETRNCLQTLQGHAYPVQSLAALDGKLCSGSDDKTIKIWDPETGNCLQTLQGHAYPVQSLAALDGKLCSGSDDKTIKLWDPETGKYLQTLQGHAYPVCSLAVLDGKLCSSSRDNTIKIWDFAAKHPVILKELADLFRSGNNSEEVMARFSKMPRETRNSIYGELYSICAPFSNDYFGCAEDAFHGRNGQSATPEQKAQAIESYLAK